MKPHSLMGLAAAALLSSCGQESSNGAAESGANAPAADSAAAPAADAASGSGSVVYPGSEQTGDRFSTSDPVDRVLAWYWDENQPMRQRDGSMWAVSKPERRDDGYLVQLTVVGGEEGQSYAIYLDPRAGGGTDGRVRPITDEELKSGVKL